MKMLLGMIGRSYGFVALAFVTVASRGISIIATFLIFSLSFSRITF
jgi:hypothetical protein